jgi:N-acetylglutamate synthase-like GNAT family acetyltransferase
MKSVRKFDQSLSWRQARSADLADIYDISERLHIALPERIEVFEDKLKVFPEGCFVLERDKSVVGYGLSHPWRLRDVPPLNKLLRQVLSSPECLLIHDVAVLPQARGNGASRVLVERLTKLAISRGIGTLALVSVYNTRPLWRRVGFQVTPADGALRDQLKSYGDSACYMVAKLI